MCTICTYFVYIYIYIYVQSCVYDRCVLLLFPRLIFDSEEIRSGISERNAVGLFYPSQNQYSESHIFLVT
jgi:hypothetical protein